MPDFRSLRYLTGPNMVLCDAESHQPGIDNRGPMLLMNPFSSRCCQHNHSHGWPYYCEHLWFATPDNGACAALYCANSVTLKVADGIDVTIKEETHYPFEEQIRFTVATPKTVRFPLYLLVPKWCQAPAVSINNEKAAVSAKPGQYIRIERRWGDGDTVTLDLPMNINIRTWASNHNSVSVDYGPLTFSLEIGEKYIRRESTDTAQHDSKWQPGADKSQWPSFEIHPTTPWNYGLVLDEQSPEKSFTLTRKPWPADDFPFTLDTVPLQLSVKARRIPQWTLDQHGLCGVLQDSPVKSGEPTETIKLVPMGAARLRISAFPVIGDGDQALKWQPSKSAEQ